MPDPFKGTRGVAQSYIPGLIEEGLGNSEIVDVLRLNDMGYRDTNMYADINRVRLENFGGEAIKNFDPDEPISARFMREWHGDTTYEYRVVIKYDYFDTNTMSKQTTGTTLYYNEEPSQSEVLEDWEIRKQTLELGAASGVNVQEIYGAVKFLYYHNV